LGATWGERLVRTRGVVVDDISALDRAVPAWKRAPMSPVGNRQASVGISGAWLYDLYRNWGSMGEIAVSQARENLAEVIESTQRSGEPIVLTRHGRPVAVVLEHAAYERLVAAADEASDRAALAQARQDDDSVPWEQVKVDLGLV